MRRTIGSYRVEINLDICEQTQFSSHTTRVLRLTQSGLLDLLLASVILLPFAASDAKAQRKLEALQQDLKPGSTRDVVCIRRRERPPVRVPMDFKVGDRLISDRRKLNARIKCGKATLTAWAPFRLEFKDNPLKTCYVGYSSKPGGGLIVQASGPTGVLGPGAAKMESANTRYGITIDRVRGRPRQQWLVYEGQVTVRSGRSIATATEGEKLVATKTGALATQKITSADIQQAARVYASMDVSQMPPSYGKGAREAAFVRLQTLHQAVFSNPKNQEHQLRLANEQKILEIPIAEWDQRLTPGPKTNRVDLTLKPNSRTTKSIPVHACKTAHRFQVTLNNLPFARLMSPAEGLVAAAQDTEFLVEFDTTGMKTGIYQGEILAPCLDCNDVCAYWIGRLIVSVNVSDEQGELKVTIIEKTPVAVLGNPTPKAPQSTESKTGIKPEPKQTVAEKPADIGAEPINQPGEKTVTESEGKKDVEEAKKEPPEKTKIPLKSPLSTKKPESGTKSDKKPQRDLKTWDIPLPPDTKTVRAFQINNPCAQDRTVNISLTDLPFARLLAKPQIKIKAGDTIHAPIEFDTTGMKIGNYQGLLELTCRDCFKQDIQCSPKSRPRSLNVVPIDFLKVNVTIK